MSGTEFNLSEKIRETKTFASPILWAEDVKEFIKETIEDIEGGFEGEELLQRLKKRAGDKLI